MQKTSTQSSKSPPTKHQNKATTEDNTNDKQSISTTSEDEDNDDDINSTHSTSSQSHKINPKIPPIMLKGADWRKVAGKLMTTIVTFKIIHQYSAGQVIMFPPLDHCHDDNTAALHR